MRPPRTPPPRAAELPAPRRRHRRGTADRKHGRAPDRAAAQGCSPAAPPALALFRYPQGQRHVRLPAARAPPLPPARPAAPHGGRRRFSPHRGPARPPEETSIAACQRPSGPATAPADPVGHRHPDRLPRRRPAPEGVRPAPRWKDHVIPEDRTEEGSRLIGRQGGGGRQRPGQERPNEADHSEAGNRTHGVFLRRKRAGSARIGSAGRWGIPPSCRRGAGAATLPPVDL